MKKNIIALAIASVVAAPVAFADAPTVYGSVNMAVEQVDAQNITGADLPLKSGTQVNSRASRLGIKGSEDLGNGLKAVYGLEFEVNIDSGTTLGNRNQFVGLAGGFGTVLMGRHDTPTKMIQGNDFFNDSPLSDIGKMAGGLGAFGKGMENRLSNVLAYVSPEFGGVKLLAAFVPKESKADSIATEDSSLTDIMSFGLTYGSTKKGLYLAAGMDAASDNYLGAQSKEAQHARVVAQYATGGLVANAMYQDFSGDALKDTVKEGSTYSAGLGYQMGKFMPKVQVMSVDRENSAVNVKAEDSLNYALGLNYSFGKKTTGYVEYALLDNTDGIKDTKAETSAVSIGLNHKF